MREFPRVARAWRRRAHAASNAKRLEQLATTSVDEFSSRLMERRPWIDLDQCTRCDECVRATPRATRGHPPHPRRIAPTSTCAPSCRSCRDPPAWSAVRRLDPAARHPRDRDRGLCIGCGLCARATPVRQHQHARDRRHGEEGGEGKEKKPEQKAITCDLCAGLKEPTCVYACPHEATARVEPKEFFARR
jgi:Fe-S-cluster-containing hydrogenase component 2